MTTQREAVPPAEDVPTPGSHEARARGCNCALRDNHYGAGVRFSPLSEPLFWYNADCPLHGYPRAA